MEFIYLLENTPIFFVSFCFVVGLVIGSFLNVVIYRLPKMLEREWRQRRAKLCNETIEDPQPYNTFFSRSACPHCAHKITVLENIPVVSYIVIKGRCSQCSVAISVRYPVIEMVTGLISGFTAWHFGYGFAAFSALIFVWALIVLAFIDVDTFLLPNEITLPMLWGGLLINLGDGLTDISSAVIGAVAGYITLWTVYWCFKLSTGKEAMGYGDFKLLAVIGAWLGWQMLPLVVLFSSIVGAVTSIGMIVAAKHNPEIPIPFGPYLVGGGLVALFSGDQVNRAYLALL
jgi:leader peptidase (prepilin peptidase) / N-methyltransferase